MCCNRDHLLACQMSFALVVFPEVASHAGRSLSRLPLVPRPGTGFFTCSKAAVYGSWLVVSSHVLADVGGSLPCIAGFVFLQPQVDSERVITGCLRASQGFAVLKVQTPMISVILGSPGITGALRRSMALRNSASVSLASRAVTV